MSHYVILRKTGYNSRILGDLLESRKDEWYETTDKQKTILVVLFLGANDAAIAGIQGVPLEEFTERMTNIANAIKTRTNANIILVTPPPVDTLKWHQVQKEKTAFFNPSFTKEQVEQTPVDRTLESAGSYAKAVCKIAEKIGAPVVDIYTSMQNSGEPLATLLSDGLHLSAAGNAHLFNALTNCILNQVPSVAPDNIEKDFHEWRDAIANFEKKA